MSVDRERLLQRKREYYARHKDVICAKQNAKRSEAPEAGRERARERYLANKDEILAAQKESYQRRRDEVLARQREYRERNAEAIAAQNRTEAGRAKWRRYDAENREARAQKARQRRALDPTGNYLKTKEYVKKKPEAKRHFDATRRARKAGAPGSFTLIEWECKCLAHGNRCVYCGAGGKMTRDHDIPLSRGGSHFITNLVPACKRCNCRKRAMTGAEYRARLAAEAACSQKE